VPANVSALILKAPPGQDLTCRAQNHKFKVGDSVQERGVVTHYASQALAKATTVDEWLKETIALSNADVQQKQLPEHLGLSLAIAGQADRRLAGKSRR
jgi:hypothetical protein